MNFVIIGLTSKLFRLHDNRILRQSTYDENPTEAVRLECRRVRISAG